MALEGLENRTLMSTVSWNVASNGDWGTASNWLDDQGVARVPTSLDDVIINPTPATVTVSISGSQAAKSVMLTGDDTLSLLNSTLTIGSSASTIANLTLTGSGTVNTTGDLTLSGTSSMANSAVLAGPGKILATGTLSAGGSSEIRTEMQVTGTLNLSSTSLIVRGATAKVRVLADAVLKAASSNFQRPDGGLGVFIETGGKFEGVSGTNSSNGALFIDGGSAKVIAGSLQFNGATSLNNASFDVPSGTNVFFNNNVANAVSGTITGTGVGQVLIGGDTSFTLAADTTFNFAAGQLQFQNNAAVVGPGTLTNKGNISGSPIIKTKIISTGSITTAGSVNFASSTAELRITDGTSFTPTGANVFSSVADAKGLVIESGGTMSAANGGISVSALLTVQPGGKLKTSPNGGIQINGVANLNGPVFDTSTGNNIFFQGGSEVTASGTWSGTGPAGSMIIGNGVSNLNIAAAGATFNFTSGMARFSSATIKGPGTLTNTGIINGSPTIATRILNTGSITPSSTVIFADPNAELRIQNGGNLTSSGLSIYGPGKGVFVETGGVLAGSVNISASLSVLGGSIKSAGGSFQFTGTDNKFNGATLDTTGGGLIFFQQDSVSSVAGTINAVGPANSVIVGNSYATLNVDAAGATLTGDPKTIQIRAAIKGPGTLTLAGGGVTFANNTSLQTQVRVSSDSNARQGLFISRPTGKLQILNGGLFDLNGGDTYVAGDSPLGLVIDAGGTFTAHGFGVGENSVSVPISNLGTIRGIAASVNLAGPIAQVTTSLGVTTLTGGRWIQDPDGLFRFGGDTITGGTKLNKVGARATIIAGQNPARIFSPIQGLAANEGTIEITTARATNGQGIAFGQNFINSGKLTVRSNSVINVGTFTQTSTGTSIFEVAGAATTSIGQIRATGAATLAGGAQAVLAPGFTPAATDHFVLMTFASRVGTFTLAPGYDPVYTNTNFALNVLSSSSSDLAADSITLPASAAVGQTLPFSFKVRNDASVSTPGSSWIDSAYLSADNVLDASDVTLGQFTHTGVLGAGLDYTNSVSPSISAIAAGDYHVILVTDSRGMISDTNRSNNIFVSTSTVSISVPTLTIGTPLSTSIPGGSDVLYRIDVPAGKTVRFTATGSSQLQLLTAVNRLPIPGDPSTTGSPLAKTLTVTGPNFVRLTNLQGGTANVTLSATLVGVSVFSATPAAVGRGPATITVTGAGFGADSVVKLFSGSNEVATASVARVDSQTLYASFNLTNVSAGSFTLRAFSSGSSSDAPAPVVVSNVVANALPVTLSLSGGGAIRAFRDTTITLEYSNPNSVDVPAPIILLASDNGSFAIGSSTDFTRASIEVLGIGKNGPAGTLAPGAKGSISINFRQINSGGHVFSNVGAFILSPTEAIDWSLMKNDLRPANMPAAAWDKIYANFTSVVGNTFGQYQSVLTALATHLDVLGQRTNDVRVLLDHVLAIAGNFGQITQQYSSSRLGFGIHDPYNIAASVNADGVVAIGSGQQFTYYIPTSSTTYATQVRGDTSTLARGGDNSFVQTFEDGSQTTFNANGTLRSTKSAAGLVTTATITNGVVTNLADTLGSITIGYNAQGLISTITDEFGRQTTFTYDALGNRTSTTDSRGTTLIEYADPATHAITKVTFPDGSGTLTTYDTFGRPKSTSNLDGSSLETIAYDAFGGTTTTDAAAHATRIDFGLTGQPRRITNARGDTILYDGTLIDGSGVDTDATGATTVQTNDANGRITGGVSAAGTTTKFGYDAAGNINSIIDALGRKTAIVHDASGNVSSVTDPAGKVNTFTYNSLGQTNTETSAGNRVVTTTYTTTGLVATQTFSDGTSASFTYDNHDNVKTATNAFGTVTYTYDSADRLTSVTYPNGLSITYVWNARGQLESKTDQSGFTTTYTYDVNGRLATVSNGGTTLAAYTYDAVGYLSRVDSGNGTYTTYTRDALGRVTLLENHAANGAIQSSFGYAYDSAGRVVSMTTLDGTSNYIYDALGQLTKAVLPGGRTIEYAYDAMGNRVSAADSGGTSTNYTTNNLNQYTAAGTTTYTYDDDGNLLTATDASGTTTYTYDTLQQLLSVSGPAGTTTYTYDAQGRRVARTVDGVTTRLLTDPLAGGRIAATFDASNVAQAHYAYGAGLSSQIVNGGAVNYYAFDALGNTSGLTDAGGALIGSYSYLPFGEKLNDTGPTTNPFTFSARGGVFDQRDGTYLTLTRLYDARQGRFIQRDPVGYHGGDLNLYRYVGNNPISFNDPSGHIPLMKALGYLKDDLHIAEVVADIAATSTRHLKLSLKLAIENEAYAKEVFKTLFREGATRESVLAGGSQTVGQAIVRAAGTHEYEIARLHGELNVRAAKTARKQAVAKAAAQRALTGRLLSLGGNLLAFEFAAFDYNLYYNEQFPDGTPVNVQPGVNQNKLINRILRDPLGRQLLLDFQSAHPGTPVTDDGLLLILQTISISERIKNKTYIKIESLTSGDPNEIIGPQGVGAKGYMLPDHALPYVIHFQNMPTAAAAAQEIFVTTTLDPNVDLSTFELTSIGFGTLTIPVLPGLQSYSTRVAYTQPGLGTSILVDVSATLDASTRQVKWTLRTLDPTTLDLPSDPATGVLPPDTSDGRGSGFVSYVVHDKSGLITGDSIKAVASIVFDTNEAIITNTWLNTIDKGDPSSKVNALAATQGSASFLVSWGGSDDAGGPVGSGIATYDIYVSDNSGAYTLYLDDTALTSTTFAGVNGHSYKFYSVATDHVGHVEAKTEIAEASTVVNVVTTNDTTKPSSKVNSLASTQTALSFTVSWTGSDNSGGSGVKNYDIYVSDNNGSYKLFKEKITAASAVFTGVNGHSYRFYSVARDNAGNVEAKPSSPDATTKISVAAPVNNAPTPAISGPNAAVRGQTLTFKFSATDVNSGDAAAGIKYKIDWGDGSSTTVDRKAGNASGVSIDHIYKNKGSFKISVKATDRNNKESSAVTRTISVAAVASLPDLADPSKLAFYIGGTTGNDVIRFDKAEAGKIKVTIGGVSQGTFSAGARLVVFAQAGNDQILVDPTLLADVWFYGGDGDDYITGSAGENIIFGNAGNDKLFAHGGRDIVVGGAGKDELHGDGGADILIGAKTDYDSGTFATQAAIIDLLAAWDSTGVYSARITKLTSTSGVGLSKAKLNSSTVHDDNAIDNLIGNAGTDWFIARTTGSNKDKVSKEANRNRDAHRLSGFSVAESTCNALVAMPSSELYKGRLAQHRLEPDFDEVERGQLRRGGFGHACAGREI